LVYSEFIGREFGLLNCIFRFPVDREKFDASPVRTLYFELLNEILDVQARTIFISNPFISKAVQRIQGVVFKSSFSSDCSFRFGCWKSSYQLDLMHQK
jgi:hypothetical protein